MSMSSVEKICYYNKYVDEKENYKKFSLDSSSEGLTLTFHCVTFKGNKEIRRPSGLVTAGCQLGGKEIVETNMAAAVCGNKIQPRNKQ